MFKGDAAHSAVNAADTLLPPFALKWTGSVAVGPVSTVAYSSPTVLHGYAYIGCVDGNLYVFNANSGVLAWKFKTNGYIYGSPAVATIGTQDYVFVGSTDGNLYGLNASTGVTVCEEPMGGPMFTSPIVVDESSVTLLICTSHSGVMSAFNINNPSNTTQSWSVTLSSYYLFSSPAYDSTNDLLFEPCYDGNLYALHAQTGLSAWNKPVSVGPTRASPSVTNGYVYNLSNAGVLTCLNKATGAVKAAVSIGSNATASPAAFRQSGAKNDTVVTAGQNGVVAEWILPDPAGAFTQVWQRKLPYSIKSSPAITSPNINSVPLSGTVLAGCDDGNLYGLNLATGAMSSTIAMGRSVQISPAVGESSLFISSNAGSFQAYFAPTPTFTNTPTMTPTKTPTVTSTPSKTFTSTFTATATKTFTVSATPTKTFTQNKTFTATKTATKTATNTPTGTPTKTVTATSTFTPTKTITNTATATPTKTSTSTVTSTPTSTSIPLVSCPLTGSWPVTNAYGVALDGQGNIYVTDDIDGLVDVLNSNGNLLNQFGGQGTGNGQLTDPSGIVLDNQGNIYVADSANDRIEIFNNQGQYLNQWGSTGTGNGEFQYPVGLALSPENGWIYVTDAANSRVQVFDTQGNYKNQWGTEGSNGAGTFETPWGIAVDAAGRVYVMDNTTSLVQVFSLSGVYQNRQWNVTANQAGLQGAEFVAADNTGVVYVSDGLGAVGMFDTLGHGLVFTQGGSAPFGEPDGLAVSGPSGSITLVVADWGNDQVDRYGPCPVQLSPTLVITPEATPTPTLTPTNTPLGSFTPTATISPTATNTATYPTIAPTANCCLTAWTVTSGPLPDVYGLAYDPSGPGTLYAGGGALIEGLDPSTGFVINSSIPADFDAITSMVRGGDGYLYVSDYNSRVFKTQIPSGNMAMTISLPGEAVRSLSVAPGTSNPDIYAGCDSGDIYHITQSGNSYSAVQMTFSPDSNPSHVGANGILFAPGASGAPATLYLSDRGGTYHRVLQYIQTSGNTYAYNSMYQTYDGNDYMGLITQDNFGDIYVGSSEDYYTFGPGFSLRWTCPTSPVYGQSIAVDPVGNVYAGHQSMDTIVKLRCSTLPQPTSTPALVSNNWVEATGNAGFVPRAGQASIYFNYQYWVIGGTTGNGGYANDVWSSPDGVNWTLKKGNAPFSPRVYHSVLVYNNQLWVIGGQGGSGSTYFSDVWSSPDGVNWTQVTSAAPFGARSGQEALVYNNLMWVIGGRAGGSTFNDVWSSPDGADWTQATASAAFGARYNFGSAVFNNRMWVLGGFGSPAYSDVWSSSDGLNWVLATANAGFGSDGGFSCLVFNDELYAIGGDVYSSGQFNFTNNVYVSPDGTNWTSATGSPIFSARSSHSGTVGRNYWTGQCEMYVFGGTTGSGSVNDVWYSPPGQTPTVTPTPSSTPTVVIPSCNAIASWAVPDPMAVAMDGQGNDYVTDDAMDEVFVFNSAGSQISQWGIQGPGNGQFNDPEGIAVDGQGNVYVSDAGNNRVEVFNNQGQYLNQWGTVGSANGQFEYPVGIAVEPGPSSGQAASLVYVADSDNGRVQVFNNQGNAVTQFGNGLNQPWGIALDANGNIYVTDFGTSLVDLFNSHYQALTPWPVTQISNLLGAEDVAVGGNGVVYVSDSNSSIGMFDTYGNWLGTNQGVTQAGITFAFNETEGLAVNSNGSTWVAADWVNSAIYQFSACAVTPKPTATVPTATATLTPIPTNTTVPLSITATPYTAFIDENANGWVITYSSAGWVTLGNASFGATDPSMAPSLTLINGTPYVAYVDANENGWLTQYNGFAWVTVGNSSFGLENDAVGPLLAAGSNGMPYVTFVDASSNGWVEYNNGSSWATVGSVPYGVYSTYNDFYGNSPSMAMSNTTPYVTYVDPLSNGWVFYASGSGWVTVGNASYGAYSYGNNPVLQLLNGTPYVAYFDADGNGWVKYYNGTNWATFGSGSFGNNPLFTDSAEDNLSFQLLGGTPYVAYGDAGNGSNGNGWLVTSTGGSWTTIGNSKFSFNGETSAPSLSLSNSATCVSFVDDFGLGWVSAYNGTSWSKVGNVPTIKNLDDDTNPSLILAVQAIPTFTSTNTPTLTPSLTPTPSGSGNSYVAFDDANSKGWVVEYNGSNWVTLGNRPFSTGSGTNALAISNANAYVAYIDSNWKGWAESFNGTNWVTVGNTSYASGVTYNTPSLAVLSGMPFVTCVSNSEGWVEYYNGSAWVTVGNSFYGNEFDTNPSLSISNGTVYVDFTGYNGSSRTGDVAEYNGSTWVTIGNGPFATQPTLNGSMTVVNGTPYVTYIDSNSNGWVEYFNGTAWVTFGNSSCFSTNNYTPPSLAMWNGTPYVSFTSANGFEQGYVVSYYNGGWITIGSGSYNSSIVGSSLLTMFNGVPYEAFTTSTNGSGWVAAYNSAWTTVGSGSYGIGGGGTGSWLQVAYALNVSTNTPTNTPTPLPVAWGQADVNAAFSARSWAGSVYYNNQYWIIGGHNDSIYGLEGTLSDVWYSSDGFNWKTATGSSSSWASGSGVLIYDQQVLPYNNQIWSLGGSDGLHYISNVYSSSSGVSWKAYSGSTPNGRIGLGAVTFNGAMWMIGGFNGGYLNDVWTYATGGTWTEKIANAAFAPREHFGCAVFNNQMWVIGGTADVGGVNDVWSSSDGINWTYQGNLPFGTNWAKAWVQNNQLYVLGYNGSADLLCFSSDGIHWSNATTPSFGTRYGSAVMAANNEALVIAGQQPPSASATIDYNDVWTSPPLATPTITPTFIPSSTPTGTLTPVSTSTPLYGSLVWRVNCGGNAYTDLEGNYWSADENYTGTNTSINSTKNTINNTSDEVLYQTARLGQATPNQTNLTYTFNVPPGNYQVTLKFAEIQIGLPGQRVFDVLINNTPVLWNFDIFNAAGGEYDAFDYPVTNISPNPSGQIIIQFQCVYGSPQINAIQIVPMVSPTPTPWPVPTTALLSACQSGLPGSQWNSVTTSGGYISNHAFILNTQSSVSQLWQIGSSGQSYSVDGVNWIMANPNSPSPYGSRNEGSYACASYNGKMWIAGGIITGGQGGDTLLDDVWSSPDGANWSEATTAAAFGPREWVGMTSFANKLWVIGGFAPIAGENYGGANDVWNSIDGKNWNPVPVHGSTFSPRSQFGCVVFNNKIWVVGGTDTNGNLLNDVWSSGDGSHWISIGSLPFPGRVGFQLVPCGNTLWYMGGSYTRNGTYNPDVWVTTDGKTWDESTTSVPFANATYFGPAISYNGQVYDFALGSSSWEWTSGCCDILTPLPTDTPTSTPTPGGSGMKPLTGSILEGISATPTISPTPTTTITPTPSSMERGGFSVVAAPNISRNGQSVDFRFYLDQPAQVDLTLFTLSGEEIYSTDLEGNSGVNYLQWNTQNVEGQSVASGLYIYLCRKVNDSTTQIRKGKILILR